MIFPYNLIGLILVIPGIYLVISPLSLFKRHNTPESFDPSTYLVQESIYRYTRNPMYLGGIIILVGSCILLNNRVSFVSPLIFFFIMNLMFIPYEENELLKTFGDKYTGYKKKVRRWI
jgi:protein-S-isoprenylcysteine O-methyltransferase Ste14